MEPWLIQAAARRPERPALITADGELTYAELAERAREAAAALAARGVKAGDRVALALPAGGDFVAALHGTWFLGAVVVPVDLRLSESERSPRTEGVAAVVDARLAAAAAGDLVVPEPSDLNATATLMFTSGTTSDPRPVELTYGNWLAAALGSAVALGLDQDERWLCPMPLAHVGGLSILIRSTVYATTVVLHERFDTERVRDALMSEREAITLVSLVPTMLARLLDAGLRDPPALRWGLLGGGPIPPALLERAAGAGVPVAPTYGMTEACSQIATHGWPLPGVELQLAAEGELLVRGATVSAGALSADGWLHTGDLASFGDRGCLRIIGRKSDTIVSGGENVAPAEVEAVLLSHPDVADAGVFARPDPEWGESVVAAVVARDGAQLDPDALAGWCRDRLAGFKVPKEFVLRDELPRGATGKLLRRALRD